MRARGPEIYSKRTLQTAEQTCSSLFWFRQKHEGVIATQISLIYSRTNLPLKSHPNIWLHRPDYLLGTVNPHTDSQNLSVDICVAPPIQDVFLKKGTLFFFLFNLFPTDHFSAFWLILGWSSKLVTGRSVVQLWTGRIHLCGTIEKAATPLHYCRTLGRGDPAKCLLQ